MHIGMGLTYSVFCVVILFHVKIAEKIRKGRKACNRDSICKISQLRRIFKIN